jgi:hypothetical protein
MQRTKITNKQKTGNRTKSYISPQPTTFKKVEGEKSLPNLKEQLGYRKKYRSAKEIKSTNIAWLNTIG